MKLPILDRRFSNPMISELPELTTCINKKDRPETSPRHAFSRSMTTSNLRSTPSLSRYRHSIDISSSQELLKNVGTRKRNSIPNVNSKYSLRSVGFRVTNLIRAKNVLSRFKKKVTPSKEQVVSEEAFEIKEMPSTPRFASTLSPEAQYATMKGYEDVVYKTLCTMYPENAQKIRRNKTPLPGVSISITAERKKAEKPKTTANRLISLRNVLRREVSETAVTNFETADKTSATTLPTNVDTQAPTTQNTPSDSSETQNKTVDVNKESGGKRSPTNEKQLVLTYRYQRAMDLLDTLRKQEGLYTLSPRKSLEEKVEPLREYNDWSYVWEHHFEKKALQSAR